MSYQRRTAAQEADYFAGQTATPTSQYSYEELADIYNQTRIDYIVPMPMNARRMREYVAHYDIDMDASVVVRSADDEVTGIGMLGLRDNRAWFTRVGVIPERRGRRTGLFIMQHLIEAACQRQVRWGQLEVIKGNDPAHHLFLKLGFETTRELMIIRRPPGQPAAETAPNDCTLTPFDAAAVLAHLRKRPPSASWVEETQSILQAGDLEGFGIELADGANGWMVYQRKSFQMAHLVFSAPTEAVMQALLYHLHSQNPTQDTKTENLPADDPNWPVFQRMGYMEAFRRIEMILDLD